MEKFRTNDGFSLLMVMQTSFCIILSTCSLLLCLATAGLCVRSRFASDYLEFANGYGAPTGDDFHEMCIVSRGGGIYLWEHLHIQGGMLVGGSANFPPGRRFTWGHDKADPQYPIPILNFVERYKGGTLTYGRRLGCEFVLERATAWWGFRDRTFYVLASLPLLTFFFALPPLAVVALARRTSRKKRGFPVEPADISSRPA
jgi:hypothetical protein